MTTRITIICALSLAVGLTAGCVQYDLTVEAATAVAKVETTDGELAPTAAIPFPSDITFDGSQSYVTGDHPASRFQWTWYSVPEGSGLEVGTDDGFDSPRQERTTFTPPVLGAYMAQLTAQGDTGDPSGNLAVATAFAVDLQGLEFELTWDQDVTDLDLHVINSGDIADYWTDRDCYFGNPSPDWGMPGEGVDNPLYGGDVDDGYGPEAVNIVQPADATYVVAVAYHNDWGTGATTAPQVDVKLDGAVLHTFEGVPLSEQDVLFMGTFTWPTEAATDTGQVLTHGGLGGPDYNEIL